MSRKPPTQLHLVNDRARIRAAQQSHDRKGAEERTHAQRLAATGLSPRPAFTLIELSAVVIVFTLLLGQVIPAVKRARQGSMQVTCQDRLGQISRAALAYAAEDPNELAIPIGKGDGNPLINEAYTSYYGFGGKSGLGHLGTANQSIWSGKNGMGSVHRPLNNILYKTGLPGPTTSSSRGGSSESWSADARADVDVYHCPADRGFSGMHHNGWKVSGLTSYDYYGTSYATNPLFIGVIAGSALLLHSNSPYMRPVSRVPSPTDTVLYWENAARYAVFANNDQLEQHTCYWPWTMGDFTANGWHETPFHFYVTFVDGHTAWMEIKGYGYVEAPPNLTPPCSGEMCACTLIRAPGLRLDTAPAELIPTHKRSSGSTTQIVTQDGADPYIFGVVDQ